MLEGTWRVDKYSDGAGMKRVGKQVMGVYIEVGRGKNQGEFLSVIDGDCGCAVEAERVFENGSL